MTEEQAYNLLARRGRAMTKDEKRLEALQTAVVAKIIYGAERDEKGTFLVAYGVGEFSVPPRRLTGPQVDAFLVGIRLGQLAFDKPFAELATLLEHVEARLL